MHNRVQANDKAARHTGCQSAAKTGRGSVGNVKMHNCSSIASKALISLSELVPKQLFEASRYLQQANQSLSTSSVAGLAACVVGVGTVWHSVGARCQVVNDAIPPHRVKHVRLMLYADDVRLADSSWQ